MSDEDPVASHPGGPRERKKLDKLERIQRAAWDLFRREGYAATTTRAVAQAAGVAAGTIFLYAPDKPALLGLAFERALQQPLADVERDFKPHSEPLDRLMTVFTGLMGVLDENRQLAVEWVRSGGATATGARDRHTSVTGRTFDCLLAALHRHQYESSQKSAVEELAHQCLSLYLGTLMLWLEGWLPATKDPRAMLRTGLERLLANPAAGPVAAARDASSPDDPRRLATVRPLPRGAGIFRDHDDFVD